VKVSTDSKIRVDRLRSEIAQLEARYDGSFPPGVYSVLESLRQELLALQRAQHLETAGVAVEVGHAATGRDDRGGKASLRAMRDRKIAITDIAARLPDVCF